MSLGGGAKKARPQFTGIQAQTSSSIVPVQLVYGANRVAFNLVWAGDFKAHKQKQKNGKGLGAGSTVYYTYSASVIGITAEGPCPDGIGKAWKDQGEETTYAALGFEYFSGTLTQAPWGYMLTAHPSEARAYPLSAGVRQPNYDLGQSASLPQHTFEQYGILYDSGYTATGKDADCALMIQDFLTDQYHGALYPTRFLDLDQLLSGPDAGTTGDSAYQTYCRAMSFGLSPAMGNQQSAGEILERWCLLTNTAPVWTGYTLKFIPWADQEISGNGVTFIPPTAVRYTLTDSDYRRDEGVGEDPVILRRSPQADAKNVFKLNIKNRANAYNPLPVTWQDQNAIEVFGRKEDDPITAEEVCDLDMAREVVALIGQRELYTRNEYKFKLGPRFTLLEPMDVVALVEAALGLLEEPVRVIEVEENDDDDLEITCKEFAAGVAVNGSGVATQGNAGAAINQLVDPGNVNTPLIMEPPSTMTNGVAQVWAAVSGGADWGGAIVYVSADGGSSYQPVGEINSGARQGVTTGLLGTYSGANPQAATVGVNLTQSRGDLIGVTAGEAAAGATLSVICNTDYSNAEYLGYRDATLTGTYAYTLGSLYRNLFSSAASAPSHASGSLFARLDDNIFRIDMPATWIGVPLKFKFASFNIYGRATQDIAGLTVYDYTPAGTGYGGGGAGLPNVPTGLAGVGGIEQATATWDANPESDNILGYRLSFAVGPGGSFGAAVEVGEANALTMPVLDLTAGEVVTLFLEARNAVGYSAPTAGVDVTVSATALLPPVYIPSTFYPDQPSTAQVLLIHTCAEPLSFDANFAGSFMDATVAAAATAVFTIWKALSASPNTWANVGTATFSAGQTRAVFASAGGLAVDFALGDRIRMTAPVTPDAALTYPNASLLARRKA